MKKKYWELNHPILRIVQHLGFWVLSFFVFLYLFKTGAKPEKIDYVYTILFQLTLIPAVYLNIELLLPKLGNRKRILFYLLSLIVLIILFAWINYNFFDNWSAKVFPDYFFISYFTFREIVLFFTVYIIITMLLKLSKSWFLVSGLQKELLEKEKQKAKVELKALKAQINPHFFFNTLNSIYSMALDKDERLPGTVLQLSDLMRYFLYVSRDNFIPLEKDLTVVKEYIALQKLRSNAQLDIETKISGEINDQKIAPLLLISFLENAFKHGVKGEVGATFIKLMLSVKENRLNFLLENNKGQADSIEKSDNKGLGLGNVKRRLELLYPGRHDLVIQDRGKDFIVNLQLH